VIALVKLSPGNYYVDEFRAAYWYGGGVDGATGEPVFALWRLSQVFPFEPCDAPIYQFAGVLRRVRNPENMAERGNLATTGTY
jgi:hypothetical protein